MPSATPTPVLDTKRGKQILMLLLAVAFLDFVDASIVNVALPSIRADLGFSVRNLQWVLTGYLLTYGGLMLLGGRASDLFGRRRLLVAGTVQFAASSLVAGLAPDDTVLVVVRMIQGAGAAMMIPAALSILTTTFSAPGDRYKAMGAWGAVGGLASAVGVFLGGVITHLIDWRWVFFVNVPAAALILRAIFRLVPADERIERQGTLDVLGAVLVTGGMLLLVYTIVEAPAVGWGHARTIAGFAVAAAILAGFVGYEGKHRNPVFPFSIFRVKGLAAADVTMITAMAGFYTMFLLITLYQQNVLGLGPLPAGAAYVPAALGVALSAGINTNLMAKLGTRPIIVAGAILGAGGIFWLSKIPVHGSYWSNILPGLMVTALGLGGVLVGTTTAAQNGVSPDKAGLAAALINSSLWLGGALGVAIFTAVATSTTADRLAKHASQPVALTAGFQQGLLLAAIFLAAAAVIALRSPNLRGEQAAPPAPAPVPTTELANETA
jgi:EmrB/QacA subfamily drug resistance transporter